MSLYQKEIDFISRTKDVLNAGHEHDKTLLLNCCVGLLIMPQQSLQRKQIGVSGEVDEVSWGIIKSDIKTNEHKKGASPLSIENIAYHFRNSIAHYRFDITECNRGLPNLSKIHIKDATNDDSNSRLTFDLEMSFSNFQKYITKYSDELLIILK